MKEIGDMKQCLIIMLYFPSSASSSRWFFAPSDEHFIRLCELCNDAIKFKKEKYDKVGGAKRGKDNGIFIDNNQGGNIKSQHTHANMRPRATFKHQFTILLLQKMVSTQKNDFLSTKLRVKTVSSFDVRCFSLDDFLSKSCGNNAQNCLWCVHIEWYTMIKC